MSNCAIDTCTRPAFCRGACRPHYTKLRKEGRLASLPPTLRTCATWEESFKLRTGAPDENGCVIWTGEIDSDGYGRATLRGERKEAHRLALEIAGVNIYGHEVDHECRVPACVNARHLRPATRKQNMENTFGPIGETSSFRGVHFVESRQKYRARVYHDKKIAFDRYFDSEADAADAARDARNQYFTYNSLDRV